MRKFLRISTFVALIYSPALLAAVGDYAHTSPKKIAKINVHSGENGATYYFIPEGNNWLASQCPNAIYAFIYENDHGSSSIMSLAISARATGDQIRFEGVCGNGSGNDQYIKIERIEL